MTLTRGTVPLFGRIRRVLASSPGMLLITLVAASVAGASGEARVQQLTTWAVYGLLSLSLVLVWGKAGIFSFAQGALFGIGAYAYGVAATDLLPVTGESLSAVLAAAFAAALAAALIGYFVFYGRLGELPVAVVTLAFSLLLLTVMSSLSDPKYHIGAAALGGYNGLTAPVLTVPGAPDGLGVTALFLVVVAVTALVAVGLRWLLRRPFGRVVRATASNPERTELLGYDTRRVRLQVFVLGGMVAGLAGALYTASSLYIDPSVFGLAQSALVVVWALVGGRGSLLGGLVGVALVEPLTSTLGGVGGDYGPIILGVILIVVVLALPGGLVSLVERLLRRRPRREGDESADRTVLAIAGDPPLPREDREPATLTTHGLSKRFGGLLATDDVSLEFTALRIHSIVGPNGAGKSTLFSLLVGRHRPTAGTIHVDDVDITHLPVARRARLGLGIKRQVSSVYLDSTVMENLWTAAYADCRSTAAADERARDMVTWLGLSARADDNASDLAHGHRQLLEIGMVLAARPKVVLLDEPTAGMTREESHLVAELIKTLSSYCTVVVVEHDMEFIRELGAPVTVLHKGAVLARGSIEEIRADKRVLSTYLGRAHADAS
ncbi:branched-chain amino acid ABC transporter ATP-binding protein/permease [Actinoallomurus sp. CA-150999]|uniref:branched-chain amino acid ABC transporter ATP-binding protein/permease n=1 Tax=Actinoallomurus sp. CA-150999 TaxID=3239887 RepID=UPI003D949BE1